MYRKDFIKLSSLGFLGLYSCGISPFKKRQNTLAIQLYTVRDAMSANLEKTLERLAAMGFTGLEIYAYNSTFFGKSRQEFQRIALPVSDGLLFLEVAHIMLLEAEGA
jgi:hypothetical protein